MDVGLLFSGAVAGLPGGAGFALVGVAIVILFRVAGVVSFVQGGVGVFGAVVFSNLTQGQYPIWVSLIIGLALSAVIGAVIGLIMAKWFMDAGLIIRSAVTIAIAVTLVTLAMRVFAAQSFGIFPYLVDTTGFTVAGVTIAGNTILAVVIAVGVAAGLGAITRWTRIGVQARAVSERTPTAALLGVRVGWYNIGTWAIAGALAAMALILMAPTKQADVATLSSTLVEGLAAALFASFVRLDLVVIAGLLIGAAEGLMLVVPEVATYAQVVPVVAIVLILLWRRRGEAWDEVR